MDFDQSTAAGLMRFRSSPGTLLTGHLAEEAVNDDSSASDHAFARFLSGESPSLTSESRDFRSHENSNNKEDSNHHHHRVGHFPATSSHMYQTVNRSDRSGGTSLGILSMEAAGAIKSSGVGLVRHGSSPAGLFSHITADNGFSVMRSTRSFGNGSMAESDPNRLKSQLSFPARQPTSGRFMSQIPELGGDTMASNSSDDDGLLATGRGGYLSGFTVSSWDESNTVAGMQSPDLMGRKRVRDHLDSKLMAGGFNITHSQKGDKLSHHPAGLTHHFSLPKTLPDMAAVEKYLQMHDSVPCKVRAKRGCATHPRSIAERVRRTRISERMRKLQELVPNMDKQTNTADMLDLAVDHIKELQKKVQALSESRSSCTCGSKHNPYGF